MKVYLAGPIDGCRPEEAEGWRREAAKLLSRHTVIDPTEPVVHDTICDIDRHYLWSSDVVLMNLLNARGPTCGTLIELGWADIMRKPVVLVAGEDQRYRTHQMVQRIVMATCSDLKTACWVINHFQE